MKVLMVHNDYRIAGGETKSVQAEATHLRAAGSEVRLLMRSTPESLSSHQAIDYLITGRGTSRVMDQAIQDFQPDIIHVQNLWPSWGVGGIRAIRHSGIPYVQTLRNYRWSCLSANHFRDNAECHSCVKSATAWRGVVRGCYRDSRSASAAMMVHDVGIRIERRKATGKPQIVIALSHAMKDRLEVNEPGKYDIRVKYNCLEQEPTGSSSVKTGLIWVGRLEPEKGFHNLLRGWETSQRPHLTIVGNGSLRAEAEDLQKRHPGLVQFHSEISHSETLRLIGESRLSVVIPLWEEPFGRVVLESLAMGTPVLHSGRGALTELIGDGGWQVATTPQATSRGIDEYYGPAELKRDFARRRYDKLLSPESTTLRLQEIYAEAIESTCR